MEINSENLIALVFERKALWDKTVKDYRNRILVDRLWHQVSTELGGHVTTEDVKRKWKNLRNSFGKELRKVPEGRSGDEGPSNFETYTTWPYFTSMLFLKNQLRSRKAGGNLSSGSTLYENDFNDTDVYQTTGTITSNEPNDIEHRDIIDTDSENAEITPNASRSYMHHRHNKRGAQQQLIDIESRKLRLLENKANKTSTCEDDEDASFFKSILPHVRKLKAAEKLKFRTEVQSLVQKYVYSTINISDRHNVQCLTPPRTRIPLAEVDINNDLSTYSYQRTPTTQQVELPMQASQGEPRTTPARRIYSVVTSPVSSVMSWTSLRKT